MTHFSPDSNLGLTSEQVEEKRRDGRQNTEPEKVTKTTGQILKDNICTLFNLFNVLIAVALALVGAWSNMLFILIIALNTLIGIVQEIRKSSWTSSLSYPCRWQGGQDGKLSEIPVYELVEEDVMELSGGNQVCSDSVILSGAVEVNESS